MTARARQPQYCDHECVCCDYGIVTREDDEPCTITNCINRAPHSSPTAPPPPTDKQCRICSQATAKAERERVLKEIHKRLWEKAFPPFSANPEYQILPWDDVKDILESLRAQQGGVSE